MLKALILLTAVVLGFALLMVLSLGVRPFTPPLTDVQGGEFPNSIAVLEKVRLGGFEQWVLIRGTDVNNPVLLWLHGGPGAAQMPLAHHTDRELEKHFVVVHWDQRGAGKSNGRGFDASSMQMDRYLEDAHELIHYLRGRLKVERIVLLGHSWGTRLGMELVKKYPELFHAYIGVSQVVNHDRATELAREWLEEKIDPVRGRGDLQKLMSIEIPARRHSEYRKLNQLTNAYGGSMDLSMWQLAPIVLRSPEYTALDYVALLRGMRRGGGPMHEGGVMESFNFMETIPAVHVPVYFFMGANDHNTPLALAREYHDALCAPRKELIVFEKSAHLPFLAETDKFNAQVIRVGSLRAQRDEMKP